MVDRDLAPRLRDAASKFPAVTVTGPRQSGKSTLCRALFPDHVYVNLESPDVRDFAVRDPRAFLGQHTGRGVILDEVQRAPQLTSYLQPLIDDNPAPGRWILTGSQNFALLEPISQSLAGRSAVLQLLPLSHREVTRFDKAPETLDESVLAGGYPRIFDRQIPASEWLSAYVATYVERDVRSLSNVGDLVTFQRFLELCAGRTGQLLNFSRLGADAGISQPTARAWFSVLEAGFIVFRLPGWSGNVRKRLVKMPKLHFYDTGLACWLLGIRSTDQLRTHPLRGWIFETWVASEIVKHRANAGERGPLHFFRDQNGTEADVLLDTPDEVTLVEAKAGQTVTADMYVPLVRIGEVVRANRALRSIVVYGGDEPQMRSAVSIVPWRQLDSVEWM